MWELTCVGVFFRSANTVSGGSRYSISGSTFRARHGKRNMDEHGSFCPSVARRCVSLAVVLHVWLLP